MSQIVSDFPQLPDHDDPNWIGIYTLVYNQLTAMGLPIPESLPAEISRVQLLKHLQLQAGRMIQIELKKNDKPDYSAKSNEEKVTLVNDYREDSRNAPPVNYVLVGLPFAPNVLTLEDVKESEKNGN